VKKNGLLSIETFRKLFNPYFDGHLDHLQMAFNTEEPLLIKRRLTCGLEVAFWLRFV
jgi:hypothetical protein